MRKWENDLLREGYEIGDSIIIDNDCVSELYEIEMNLRMYGRLNDRGGRSPVHIIPSETTTLHSIPTARLVEPHNDPLSAKNGIFTYTSCPNITYPGGGAL
jgi:hypothetical protein